LVPIDDSDDEGSGVSEVVEGLCWVSSLLCYVSLSWTG
jgi:hypothetical protein